MMSSYHRRILVDPRDSESTALIKLGSGGASLGYYMYHGGENPDGKLSTLMESQATGMWNDMPVKNYDFQTALGAYGQIRPQYHLLRRLHLFLREWGPQLSQMPAIMPDQRPQGREDLDTLRWSVRSDGQSGFVFVNNYYRLHEMPAKEDTQFALKLSTTTLTFPETPVTVPANDCFVWPFNLELGPGIVLRWATAQPITAVGDGKTRTVFFAATKGVAPEFAFDRGVVEVQATSGKAATQQNQIVARVASGTDVALKLTSDKGRTVQVVVLDGSASLDVWKANWQGQDRVFLSHAGLVVDGNDLRMTSSNPNDLSVGVYPAPLSVECSGQVCDRKDDGVFQRFTATAPGFVSAKAAFQELQPAGPLREIPLGKIDRPVAAAPLDKDFDNAAIWRLRIPSDIDLTADPILRLDYVGDVARLTLNGKLLTDDFYNGNALEVGLRRWAPEIFRGDLRLAVLPLRKGAPIYMADRARPDFSKADSVASLRSVEIVPRYQVQLTAHRNGRVASATEGK
jgi:hypothetical protein